MVFGFSNYRMRCLVKVENCLLPTWCHFIMPPGNKEMKMGEKLLIVVICYVIFWKFCKIVMKKLKFKTLCCGGKWVKKIMCSKWARGKGQAKSFKQCHIKNPFLPSPPPREMPFVCGTVFLFLKNALAGLPNDPLFPPKSPFLCILVSRVPFQWLEKNWLKIIKKKF